MLFPHDKKMGVKRFYHLDYYYYLAFLLGKNFNNFDEIFKATIQHQNELSDISTSINSRDKFKTEYQIKSAIEEMIRFNLFKLIDKINIEFTAEGIVFYGYIMERNFIAAEKMLCQKMESHYGQPSQLINYFRGLNKLGNGLVVFPRPSPSALNFSTEAIITGNKLEDYCRACSEYSSNEIYKFMGILISKEAIFFRLFTLLNAYFERMDYRKQSINIPREVKTIMYSFYIDTFLEGKFEAITFDIWIKRAKELKILNSTELFPGFNGLIIYPISVLVPQKINNEEFVLMAITNKNEQLFRYEPKWERFKERYVQVLWDNYIELSRSSKNFFVSVQDLRDIVCFKLQISENTFAKFLGNAYNETMNEIIRQFKISLEVDRSPQERTFKNSKRYPILINNVPKNIIGIKMS